MKAKNSNLKSIDIFGHTLNIIYNNNIESSGYFDNTTGTIFIRTIDKEGNKFCSDQILNTLIHESIHCILIKLGYLDLYGDEKLVHGLSEGVCQLIKQL